MLSPKTQHSFLFWNSYYTPQLFLFSAKSTPFLRFLNAFIHPLSLQTYCRNDSV